MLLDATAVAFLASSLVEWSSRLLILQHVHAAVLQLDARRVGLGPVLLLLFSARQLLAPPMWLVELLLLAV
jgi:hypothetical protein